MDATDVTIPATLAGLLYAALGTVGDALSEDSHPWAETVATVIEIFENGMRSQVGEGALVALGICGLHQVDSILDGEKFVRDEL